ncbi:glutathione S-transferase N-terminal domain-containing protein [Marinomonas balearica]|uniref:Glutathione S-transferase n=1 Tax=Marinomonas balearica TaxID=491947 RepID=A0A4R6MLG6_9GAMM|nr:glutathione S-transferase family protein [Marinomonas balearica]TDP01851.1 glutathione S-transferase [Marinomonas balearica]
MKLYLNETSPFSRVVTAVALMSEKASVELVWVDPWSSPDALKQVNPFCIIPALELDDGTVLTESMVICQYLLATYRNVFLAPMDLTNKQEMALLGSAKTLMDVAFKTVALKRFTEGKNELTTRGIEGLKEALLRSKTDIRKNPAYKEKTLATLYFHIALAYIQLRHEALFEQHAAGEIEAFLEKSPFSDVLETISLETLAEKPSFEGLRNSI